MLKYERSPEQELVQTQQSVVYNLTSQEVMRRSGATQPIMLAAA